MKNLLKKLLAIAMLMGIGVPLCIAIVVAVTVTLWPIDIILRLLDWTGHGFAEAFEEFIFACYGFGALFIYIPCEILNNSLTK